MHYLISVAKVSMKADEYFSIEKYEKHCEGHTMTKS